MYHHQEKSESEEKVVQSASKAGIQRENKNPQFQHELQLKEKTQNRNDTGLPDHLKSGIENLSGHSMDDVKVHYNSAKPAQLNAHAYAQGNQIHLGSGQERHLAHEAWHVVQQKQGRVQPTVNVNGAKINDDVGLEKEADVMGGKALQMKDNQLLTTGKKNVAVTSYVSQGKNLDNKNCSSKTIYQRIVAGMDTNADEVVSGIKKPEGFFSKAESGTRFNKLILPNDGDSVITLWGHAGQGKFGGDLGWYTAKELVDELINRGLKFSNHTELQVLGCMPSGSEDGTMSYAQQLQSIFNSLYKNKTITRKVIVKTFPQPKTYDSSTTYTYHLINKYLYIYGPLELINQWQVNVGKTNVDGSDKHKVQMINYKNNLIELSKLPGLKWEEGNLKNVRDILVEPEKPSDYKKGENKSDLTELLIESHH